MTTINEFGKEVFKSNIDLPTILTFGLINGIEKLEKVVKNSFCKEQSDFIINVVNSLQTI